MPEPDLTVEFCGLRLSSPLILASGSLGESVDAMLPFLIEGAAAVIPRTIRLHVTPDRKVFPSPHLLIGSHWHYMLNCEWGNLAPWEYWVQEGFPRLSEYGDIIVSISGRNIEDCVELACQLRGTNVSLFEINVSCSHSGFLYGRLTDDAAHISQLVTKLKKVVKIPIMVKLGWSPALPEIAQIAVKAGADAISTTNTIGPGLDVRLEDGRPELGVQSGVGGISGRAIFPLALQCVSSVAEAVQVPIMGIGGVSSYREVVKMMMVGASCVQIYTEAYLRGPQLFGNILRELTSYLKSRQLSSIRSIQGVSRAFLHEPTNLEILIPEVIAERCTACDVCSKVCPVDAIDVQSIAVIDAEVCIGCGACVHACPPVFSAIKRP